MATQKTRLTGNQVKFIRSYLQINNKQQVDYTNRHATIAPIEITLRGIIMGGKYSRPTTLQTQSPVANVPTDTTPAAGETTTASTANIYPSEMKILNLGDSIYEREMLDHVIGDVGEFLPRKDRLAYAVASQRHPDALFGYPEPRNVKITKKLLSAVAYGMESATVNLNPTTDNIFKEDYVNLVTEQSIAELKQSRLHNKVLTEEEQIVAELIEKPVLFAEDLLKQSPEFLLERGDITDCGGRTFQNITAFEYALWAKDFKMLEMMVYCIPNTLDGDEIRAALLKQYNQVKASIEDGGGLTYTLTYNRPNLDTDGIPIKNAAGNWETTSVTERHTENHFDLTRLITAYQDYYTNFVMRTQPQNFACRTKIIGTLQWLLPIHLLQRYWERNRAVFPLSDFTGVFKRKTGVFDSWVSTWHFSLLATELVTDFSLNRINIGSELTLCLVNYAALDRDRLDLRSLRKIDTVSTDQIETKIKLQLTPLRGQTYLRPVQLWMS